MDRHKDWESAQHDERTYDRVFDVLLLKHQVRVYERVCGHHMESCHQGRLHHRRDFGTRVDVCESAMSVIKDRDGSQSTHLTLKASHNSGTPAAGVSKR